MKKRIQLRIKGIAQGVGFRPFLYNLAEKYQLSGFVFNDSLGVVVEVEGSPAKLEKFLNELKRKFPPASFIESLEKKEIASLGEKEFTIKKSQHRKDKFVFIPFDLSVCQSCLKGTF